MLIFWCRQGLVSYGKHKGHQALHKHSLKITAFYSFNIFPEQMEIKSLLQYSIGRGYILPFGGKLLFYFIRSWRPSNSISERGGESIGRPMSISSVTPGDSPSHLKNKYKQIFASLCSIILIRHTEISAAKRERKLCICADISK